MLALVIGLLVAALLAPAAHADLKPGSRHALKTGSGPRTRLAMPLPTVTKPVRIVRARNGSVHARVRVRYRASNWKGGRGVARDRVMVTFRVAQRLLTTGPDPSKPRWHKAVVHQLRHRTVERTYAVTLPKPAASFLDRHGAFSESPSRRAQARRLLWADVQQDRDFLHVDGARDWREGNASNAGDARGRRAARAASNDGCSSNSPCGTLTVQNQTANGVYATSSTYASSSGGPGTIAGTANQTGVPLAVGGSALQCFYQGGVGGSNPSGFANFDGAGNPQAYQPGTVSGGANGQPASSGTAVTQPIAADDSIQRASNEEVATETGFLTGILNEVVNFGAFALNTYTPSAGGLAMIVMGESSLPIPSPGAVVSAGLNIAEAVIEASCDGNLNLMGLAAAEPGGGIAAESISASKEGFAPATTPVSGATSGTAGSSIAGTQLNPSNSMFNGSPLWLQPDTNGGGVQGNVTGANNTNFVDYVWTNFDPCLLAGDVNQPEQLAGTCNYTPAGSPTVTSDTGNVNCGANNAQCPFPAANFPAGTPTTFDTNPIAVSQPSAAPATTLGQNECATQMAGGEALPSGQSISSPSGLFTLTMQADGTLALLQNNASGPQTQLWSSSGTPTAGAYAAMQTSGNLAVLSPQNAVTFQTSTTTTGLPQLAVQNDGNVVVYDSATGDAVWATNTSVVSCSTPGPASAPTSTSPITTTSANGCATVLAGSDTRYLAGTSIASPDGQTTLGFTGALFLYPTSKGIDQWTFSSQSLYPNPPATVGGGVPQGTANSYLVMQTDGNLVVYYPGPGVYSPPGSDGPSVAFATNTSGNPGAYLAVQNDGNLVLYSASNGVLWATNTVTGTSCPPP